MAQGETVGMGWGERAAAAYLLPTARSLARFRNQRHAWVRAG